MKRVRLTDEITYGTALDRLTGSGIPAQRRPKEYISESPKTAMIKISVFLNQEEDTYLETLASISKFSGGKKISKTKLIETMVNAFSTTKLDIRGVKTDEELFKRVTAQLR